MYSAMRTHSRQVAPSAGATFDCSSGGVRCACSFALSFLKSTMAYALFCLGDGRSGGSECPPIDVRLVLLIPVTDQHVFERLKEGRRGAELACKFDLARQHQLAVELEDSDPAIAIH